VVSAHGGVRLDDPDLDEAVLASVDGEDNPENSPPQIEYWEVILDSVQAWWIGDGVSNASVRVIICITDTDDLQGTCTFEPIQPGICLRNHPKSIAEHSIHSGFLTASLKLWQIML